jgi:hypothetical protein
MIYVSMLVAEDDIVTQVLARLRRDLRDAGW